MKKNQTVPPMLTVLNYHAQTKHHFHKYARSSGYLDWENQPDPFRIYKDTEQIKLDFLKVPTTLGWSELFEDHISSNLINKENLSAFFEFSMALSSWKTFSGSSWSLRMHPSSGNLHPTEAYLILPEVKGCESGIYHYSPLNHRLERRAILQPDLLREISKRVPVGFLLGLSSIFWRESWKYGERAFRYTNLDLGHVLAQLAFSASMLGWSFQVVHGLSTSAINDIFGVGKTRYFPNEEEHFEVLCWITPKDKKTLPQLSDSFADLFANLEFFGEPNRLSQENVNWSLISEVNQAVMKPETSGFTKRDWIPDLPAQGNRSKFLAEEVFRKRRSAVAYDPGGTWMDFEDFLQIMDKCLPRNKIPPFNMALGQTYVHLFIFVHRVKNLERGLYCLIRDPDQKQSLVNACCKPFLWHSLENSKSLYLLKKDDFSQTASLVSCGQSIAGDSCFSLAMVAHFDALREKPWLYPRFFWEAGAIGQVIYLESEARGFRGTGIGCYFDDEVHSVLGFAGDRFQSIYHFTAGTPVQDERASALPPYWHLAEKG